MIRRKIPVSVVVVTKDEAHNMARCLTALSAFDDIVVVDSNSADGTVQAAKSFQIKVENFIWNGAYPKKRQWILENIQLKHQFVFFVDADEEVTKELCDEIRALDFKCAGYFVQGAYVVGNKTLKFGLKNSKLCLINKDFIEFPIIDDLGIEGMGEIEGHYQPVLKRAAKGMKLGYLKAPLRHYAMQNMELWHKRHKAYAMWHAQVMQKNLLPKDPLGMRNLFKKIFYTLPLRGHFAFIHSYVLRGGFLDGAEGLVHAKSRYAYYRSILSHKS